MQVDLNAFMRYWQMESGLKKAGAYKAMKCDPYQLDRWIAYNERGDCDVLVDVDDNWLPRRVGRVHWVEVGKE